MDTTTTLGNQQLMIERINYSSDTQVPVMTPKPVAVSANTFTNTKEQLYATWPEQYRHKLTTAEEALKLVKSGQRVYIGGGCGEPLVLAQRLAHRWPELRGVEIVHILTAGHAAY